MTAEQAAQKALDERGYVVLGSGRPLLIGSVTVIAHKCAHHGESDSVCVVMGQTDRSDMIEQLKLLDVPDEINCSYFYRCIAE